MTFRRHRGGQLLGALAVVLTLLGCQQPDSCDGLSREIGGCEPNQPVYAGDDCADLGRQFGEQLDERLLDIVGAPPPRDLSHAAKAGDDLVVLILRLNFHLQSVNVSCTPQEIFENATPELSAAFWEEAPQAVYDNPDFDGPPIDIGREEYEQHLLSSLNGIQWREGSSDT